jgi:hypothetical protein
MFSGFKNRFWKVATLTVTDVLFISRIVLC